jgi:hypothetical protein
MGRATLLALVILAAFAIITMVGCAKQEDIEKEISGKDPDVNIGAAELCRQFEAYYDNAKKLYTDKIIVVDGTVDKVDDVCVMLKSDTSMLVKCYFADTHKAEIDKLKSGDETKIKGKCSGSISNVNLQGCTFPQ